MQHADSASRQPSGASNNSQEGFESPLIGRWAKFCHDHYCVVVVGWIVTTVACMFVVFLGSPDTRCAPDAIRGQMQVCQNTPYDLQVTNGKQSIRKDALLDAWAQSKDDFALFTGSQQGAVPERTSTPSNFRVTFVYEYPPDAGKRDQSIFTPATVKAMCEQEATVTFHPLWPLFCVLDPVTAQCAEQPTSVVRFFYAPEDRDPSAGGCQLLSEEAVTEAAGVLLSDLEGVNGFFVNRAAQPRGFTNATRSTLQLGGPLRGFTDLSDDLAAQTLLYDSFLQGFSCPAETPGNGKYTGLDICEALGAAEGEGVRSEGPDRALMRRFGMEGLPRAGAYEGSLRSPYFDAPVEVLPDGGELSSRFWAFRFQDSEFMRVVSGDLNFALLSVVAVYLYIWLHVRSTFIAACSMLQIILSLPAGFFVYYNILQYRYYSQLHILTVYLALGIGADDVFVFIDAWRQGLAHPEIHTAEERLWYTLDRAFKACFTTTFTTVVSFIATSLNPLMPIHAFAVYASVVLVFNYVFTVTLLPAVMMIHHVYFSTRSGCCCCRCGLRLCPAAEELVEPDLEELRAADCCFGGCARLFGLGDTRGGVDEHEQSTAARDETRADVVLERAPGLNTPHDSATDSRLVSSPSFPSRRSPRHGSTASALASPRRLERAQSTPSESRRLERAQSTPSESTRIGGSFAIGAATRSRRNIGLAPFASVKVRRRSVVARRISLAPARRRASDIGVTRQGFGSFAGSVKKFQSMKLFPPHRSSRAEPSPVRGPLATGDAEEPLASSQPSSPHRGSIASASPGSPEGGAGVSWAMRGKQALRANSHWQPGPDEEEEDVAWEEEGEEEEEKLRWTECFFRDRFSSTLFGDIPGQRKPVAWLLIVAFTVFAGCMLWQALQLTPPSAAEAWFPAPHLMVSSLYERLNRGWWGGSDNEFLPVNVVFGVRGIDRSAHDRFFPSLSRGSAEFDPSFDVTTEAGQLFFVAACDEVRAARCPVDGVCVYDALVKPDSAFRCAVEDLRTYYRTWWPGADPAATHVPSANFTAVWQRFLTDEAMVDVWYAGTLGSTAARLAAHQALYQNTLCFVDGRVAFATFRFVASFPSPAPYRPNRQFYNFLEETVEGWAARAPAGMQSIFQTDDKSASSGFTWMAVEDALVENLLLGFAICFPAVLLVLVLVTGNVLLALYATLSIAYIVACVLGSVRGFLGWDLGVAESIAGVVVIGFSVDYTVHLGHMYNAAQHLSTREDKTRYALTYIGPTIVGGGLTTLFSAVMLFFCTLKFFSKMATLLALTVSLSAIHALLFFTSLCAVAGPTNGFGDVPFFSASMPENPPPSQSSSSHGESAEPGADNLNAEPSDARV